MFRARKERVGWLVFALFLVGGAIGANAADAKMSGLQFGIGQPMESPAARVSVAEIVQGAQKRGFLRISVLPLVVANGVRVRFERADAAALQDVRATIRSLVKLDAQELRRVEFFVRAEPRARLVAEEVVTGESCWDLKRVSFLGLGRVGEVRECRLMLTGAEAGVFVIKGGSGDERILLSQLLELSDRK